MAAHGFRAETTSESRKVTYLKFSFEMHQKYAFTDAFFSSMRVRNWALYRYAGFDFVKRRDISTSWLKLTCRKRIKSS